MNLLKGWRTVAANLLTIILSVLEMSRITDYLPSDQVLWFLVALAIGNIVLRLITSTPVGRPE